jgi:hypothetical protein
LVKTVQLGGLLRTRKDGASLSLFRLLRLPRLHFDLNPIHEDASAVWALGGNIGAPTSSVLQIGQVKTNGFDMFLSSFRKSV